LLDIEALIERLAVDGRLDAIDGAVPAKGLHGLFLPENLL
jgi:hypothetical protein